MRYTGARLAQAVPLLILISVAAFAIMHAAPGGPMTIYARNSPVSGSQIARTRQSMGLDEPLPVQYIKWLGSLLRGDWGHSFASGRPVLPVILERVPATLLLLATAFTIALTLALVLGVVAALTQHSKLDH